MVLSKHASRSTPAQTFLGSSRVLPPRERRMRDVPKTSAKEATLSLNFKQILRSLDYICKA